MKALKVIVVGMAVVLVAGFVALFVTWQDRRVARREVPAPAAARPPEAGDGRVVLPAGSRVVGVASAETMLDVLVENGDGTRDVYQVARDGGGAVQGVLRFRPEAP
ncbi:MAG: hypothetical protein HZA24_02510 [Nitrospirae bacterium]|nr:hypothetical protein [Nitrospirota bacterium]